MTAEEALKRLKAGNERFVSGRPAHPNCSCGRRQEILKGQKPFAVVLSCSDSRAPPELIFDCGFGDIFVIREAGNTYNDVAIGAMEYVVGHLGARLVIVMGHSDCGAVKAAVSGAPLPGKIPLVLEEIKPAVERARRMKGDVIENAIREHVRIAVEEFSSCGPILSEKVKSGELRIVGAYYDLATGEVAFLE